MESLHKVLEESGFITKIKAYIESVRASRQQLVDGTRVWPQSVLTQNETAEALEDTIPHSR